MPHAIKLSFLALAVVAAGTANAQSDCTAVNDVLLTGGVIHTMDADGTVVESVHIVGDRIAATGNGRLGATDCAEVIDLNGRTAVPGVIDNHNHIVLLGLRPRPRPPASNRPPRSRTCRH